MVTGMRSRENWKLVEWEVPAGQPGGSRGSQECGLPLPIDMEHAHIFRDTEKLLEIRRGSAAAPR